MSIKEANRLSIQIDSENLNLKRAGEVLGVSLRGLLKSPIWLKFYPCFPGFDLFKSAYTLVGYVTFKKNQTGFTRLKF